MKIIKLKKQFIKNPFFSFFKQDTNFWTVTLKNVTYKQLQELLDSEEKEMI